MQRYTYSRLPPRHIRLLLLERRPGDNQLQGSLIICPLSEHPRYEALSYVWGAEDPKFPLGCEEPIFDVPQNLYTALQSIMSLTEVGECRTLWIDQICINQKNDPVEKTDQVKLMRDIYESAHDVLVWLGDTPPGIVNVTAYLEQLPSIAKKIELNVVRIGPNFLPSIKTGLPLNNDPAWVILVDILHKPWYQRVWTLQEAVLAKRLVVYYGTNILDWDLVVKLHAVYGAAPLMPLRNVFDLNERNYQPIKWIQTYRKRREKKMKIDFTHLLWTCGFKECGNPVDRIYGMLGMADNSIREKVHVEYPGQERQAFLDAFRAAIQYDHQLHLLSLSFDRGDTMGLPTWCPNLRKWNGCVQLNSYYVGIKSSDDMESSIVTLTDSDFLRIQGLEVDRISSIASAQHPGFERTDPVERARQLSEFRDETLKLTQSVYQTADPAPEDYCRTLIADVAGGRKWSKEEMIAGYKSQFTQDPLLRAHLNTDEKSLGGKYSSSATQACAGRKYIATTNGRVGLAPATCQLGDIICVFLGACVPHVLRPNDADADVEAKTFSFVGDCYVHGLMNSEALVMLEEGRLERREFTIT